MTVYEKVLWENSSNVEVCKVYWAVISCIGMFRKNEQDIMTQEEDIIFILVRPSYF